MFAYTDELEAWLRGGEPAASDDVEPLAEEPAVPPLAVVAQTTAPAASARSSKWPVISLLAFGAVGLVSLAIAGTLAMQHVDAPPARVVYRPDSRVQDLYLDAVYHLGTRQADGFTHAIQLLTEATTLDPNYADAYVKLAEAYNTVSQFTLMSANEAYPRAVAAAERAIALEPDNAGAYAALGFTTFYWTKDFPRSRELFERAIRLDPNAAQTHHWYALTLMMTGETPSPWLRKARRRR